MFVRFIEESLVPHGVKPGSLVPRVTHIWLLTLPGSRQLIKTDCKLTGISINSIKKSLHNG